MLPTPENPLVLIYSGNTPAMKNSTKVSLAVGDDGNTHISSVGRSKTVRTWLNRTSGDAEEQMENQGFSLIPMPYRVGAWVRIGFYLALKSKAVMSKQDADNAYTSIQETWQKTVISDDRQVVDYHVSEMTVRSRPALFSVALLWSLDPQKALDDNYCTDQFVSVYNRYKDQRIWELVRSANTKPVSRLQPMHLKDKRL